VYAKKARNMRGKKKRGQENVYEENEKGETVQEPYF
jgi:hypothetical protein